MGRENHITKIACIGDSITYGETLVNRGLDTYPALLGKMLGKGYEVRSFGRNGAGLWRKGFFPYTSTEEYRQAQLYGADIYVIFLGTNDIIYPNKDSFAEEFAEDYARLIAILKSNTPNAVVLLGQIPPVPGMFRKGEDEAVMKLNEVIARVAQNNDAYLIDFYRLFDARDNLFTDGVHPNQDGAKLLAEAVCAAIRGSIQK